MTRKSLVVASSSRGSDASNATVASGSFASYRLKVGDKTTGQKIFALKDLDEQEGQRVHASNERTTLSFFSAQPDISQYIARLKRTEFERQRGSGSTTSTSTTFQPRATRHGDRINLVMDLEHIKGSTLLDRLRCAYRKPVKVKDAIRWCVQLCEGLALAHSRYRVSHGDLKLDNIMVESRTNRLVIIDWGSSRWNENTSQVTKMITGNVQCSGPEFLALTAHRAKYTTVPKKRAFDAIKNDVFCVGNIMAWIWSVCINPMKPQSGVGSLFDTAIFQEQPAPVLLQAQIYCLRRLYDGEGPKHLIQIPKFFREWILEFLIPSETERPHLVNCLYEMAHATVEKYGERFEVRDFLSLPLDEEGNVRAITPHEFLLTRPQLKPPTLSSVLSTWEVDCETVFMDFDGDHAKGIRVYAGRASNMKSKKAVEKLTLTRSKAAKREMKARNIMKHANSVRVRAKDLSRRAAGLRKFAQKKKNLAMLEY